MALNSDLGSTMLELAGLPAPASHTGRSLLPILRGATPKDWRRDFLCEFIAVPRTIPRWEGVRDRECLYARYFVDGPDKPPFEFAHDLRNDPQQLVNLAALPARSQTEDHALALTRLRKRCDELVAANGLRLQDLKRSRK